MNHVLHRTSPLLLALVGSALDAQVPERYFDAPQVVLDSRQRYEGLLDFDGDGDLDAIGWFFEEETEPEVRIRWYANPGDGDLSQTLTWDYQSSGLIYSQGKEANSHFEVADFDLDGREDFVISFRNRFYVYDSAAIGQTSFEESTYSYAGTWSEIQDVDVADVDADGFADIVVLVQNDTFAYPDPASLMVFSGAGDTADFQLLAHVQLPGLPHEVLVGEFDADGGVELALVDDDHVHVYDWDGASFVLDQSLAHTTAHPMPVAGDIDGDGDDDVVIFGMQEYELVRQTAAGAFVVEAPTLGGPATHLGDLDGDGDLDGLCCAGSGGNDKGYNLGASRFEIAINSGDGSFAPSFALPSVGAHHLAGAADVDGDGDVDLVGGRCIYYQDQPIGPASLPEVGLEPPFACGDVDGDLDVDFAPSPAGYTLGLGDGRSQASGQPALAAPAGHVWGGAGFPIDDDGDGDLDLYVSLWTDTGWLAGTRRLESRGGAYFDAGYGTWGGATLNVPDQSGGSTYSSQLDDARLARTGDLDGDGDLDLVVNNDAGAALLGIWLNDGNGKFVSAGERAERAMELGDFDGDGKLDLLGTLDDALQLSFGAGDGSFGAPIGLGVVGVREANLDRVGVADIDADGDLDIAQLDGGGLTVLQSGSAIVHGDYGVLWNDGQGSFSFEAIQDSLFGVWIQLDHWQEPRKQAVFALQLDADPELELVVGPRFLHNNQLSAGMDEQELYGVLDRNATNTGWLDRGSYALTAFDTADVDGDGDTDLLGNGVLRNTLHQGTAAGLREQYGAGAAGSAGIEPCLGASGPFRVGEAVEFRLSGALPGMPGVFAFSFGEPTPAFALTPAVAVYVNPLSAHTVSMTSTGASNHAGDGGWSVPVAVQAGMAGLEAVHQAIQIDLGAEGLLSASAALRIVYGE